MEIFPQLSIIIQSKTFTGSPGVKDTNGIVDCFNEKSDPQPKKSKNFKFLILSAILQLNDQYFSCFFRFLFTRFILPIMQMAKNAEALPNHLISCGSSCRYEKYAIAPVAIQNNPYKS